MKLHIKPEDNPKFDSLIKTDNEVMEEWNTINNRLHKFRIPHMLPSLIKRKRDLQELAKNLENLQSKWSKYNADAMEFILNPVFNIPEDTNQDLTFYLYHVTYINRINQLRSDMTLIMSNYNLV